jgi:thiol:disulfide interchange protein DsbD
MTALMLAATAALALAMGGNVVRMAEEPAAAAVAGERWQPWSEAKTSELLAAGRPVFVDFTAAWCITCQYNERATLNDAAVLAGFDAKHVALLRADWTRRNPAIGAALTALGRSGVPVYVLHAPGKAPVVLTEILGVEEVRAALAAL